jgi:hypothetical protein
MITVDSRWRGVASKSDMADQATQPSRRLVIEWTTLIKPTPSTSPPTEGDTRRPHGQTHHGAPVRPPRTEAPTRPRPPAHPPPGPRRRPARPPPHRRLARRPPQQRPGGTALARRRSAPQPPARPPRDAPHRSPGAPQLISGTAIWPRSWPGADWSALSSQARGVLPHQHHRTGGGRHRQGTRSRRLRLSPTGSRVVCSDNMHVIARGRDSVAAAIGTARTRT